MDIDASQSYEDTHHPTRPSKSQQKRASEALQILGEQLIRLPSNKLESLNLPTELFEAVRLAQDLTAHHGAYKRQRKYIGKLLRELDADPIRERLADLNQQSAKAIHTHHQIEYWRDRLLAGNDHDINALTAAYPHIDRQKLRQLVLTSRKERTEGHPPRAFRLLFQYLREILNSSGRA